jgi:hypothetical protein
LWIILKKTEPLTNTRAQCGLVDANVCKYTRDQRLNVRSTVVLEIIHFWLPIR